MVARVVPVPTAIFQTYAVSQPIRLSDGMRGDFGRMEWGIEGTWWIYQLRKAALVRRGDI
jgi:hypothetical protein